MSLTDSENVFVGIHESALNDLITAVVTDRPRLLVYGSPSFVPSTTVLETRMDSIPFPGVPGGIQWRIRLSDPHIDLYDEDMPLPPELTLTPGQFTAKIGVELCLECRRLRIDPAPPPRDRPHDPDQPDDRDKPHDKDNERDPHPLSEATCCRLEVFVIGHLLRVSTTSGEDAITFGVDAVELVDVAPDDIESVFECLLFMILQAVLATVRIPLRALRVGAFDLSVTFGPLIERDQIMARGSF